MATGRQPKPEPDRRLGRAQDRRRRQRQLYEGAVLKEQTLAHQAGLDGAGGSSYIDSVLLRTTYNVEGAEDLRFYYNQNWRADIGVLLDDSGVQLERAVYSPYGQVFGLAAGDNDFDGDYDTADDNAIGTWSGYDAFVDVDLSGTISNADQTSASTESLGWDVLSTEGNRCGNAGYTQDRDISQFYHGRGYAYSNLLGRTLARTGGLYGAGDFVCYSPCGCEIGGDSTLGGCAGPPWPPVTITPRIPSIEDCKDNCDSAADRLIRNYWMAKACEGLFLSECYLECELKGPNPTKTAYDLVKDAPCSTGFDPCWKVPITKDPWERPEVGRVCPTCPALTPPGVPPLKPCYKQKEKCPDCCNNRLPGNMDCHACCPPGFRNPIGISPSKPPVLPRSSFAASVSVGD